ncbi:hypothetical protein RRG08_001341 [Elysia crispata]|uniref:Uncharacterized protein n=1 Tax=Elysia crispata TaxID=231223 RepID=A0AAE1DLV5_9GAST|nr:hypothetical protein RRG08_001341 [Elysia crispata]
MSSNPSFSACILCGESPTEPGLAYRPGLPIFGHRDRDLIGLVLLAGGFHESEHFALFLHLAGPVSPGNHCVSGEHSALPAYLGKHGGFPGEHDALPPTAGNMEVSLGSMMRSPPTLGNREVSPGSMMRSPPTLGNMEVSPGSMMRSPPTLENMEVSPGSMMRFPPFDRNPSWGT